jgi:hypothetical protein
VRLSYIDEVRHCYKMDAPLLWLINLKNKKRPHGLVVAGSGFELTSPQKVSFIPLQIS